MFGDDPIINTSVSILSELLMSKTIGNNVKARNTHPTKLFTNNIPYFFTISPT